MGLGEVTHRWLVYGDYEGPCLLHWRRNWLAAGGVFVDSGSKIGQYVVSPSYLTSVETFAFELVSHERDWLQSCLLRYPDCSVEFVALALVVDQQELKIRLAGGKSTRRQDWCRNQKLDEEIIEVTLLVFLLNTTILSVFVFAS